MFAKLYLPASVDSGAPFALPVSAGGGPPNQSVDVILHASPSLLTVPEPVQILLDSTGNGYVQVRATLTKSTTGTLHEVTGVLALVSTRNVPPVVSEPDTKATVVR